MTESTGIAYFRAPLRRTRDVAQLVEYASGGRVVAGSSPVIPTQERGAQKALLSLFRH
jgi:hypothetical protein